MPTVDPQVRFWVGIVITIAVGISQGTVSLTNAIPAGSIPSVTAWAGILAFVGSALLTGLNALASTSKSRLASVVAIPEVTRIETTSAHQADAGGDKVVEVPKQT
jgi:hypothetical protein